MLGILIPIEHSGLRSNHYLEKKISFVLFSLTLVSTLFVLFSCTYVAYENQALMQALFTRVT